jgi:hypothetical protein
MGFSWVPGFLASLFHYPGTMDVPLLAGVVHRHSALRPCPEVQLCFLSF